MRKHLFSLSVFFMVLVFSVTGCATTRAKKSDPKLEQQDQISQLQADVETKDQRIQELEAKVETYEQALQQSTYSGYAGGTSYTSSSKSSIIRVSGVSVEDVQRALIRAGFDPGPVDGRAGKKTKAAIREFQRRNNLSADGIVGQKTWTHLK